MDLRALATQIMGIYEALDFSTIESLRTIYHAEVTFEDPAHSIQGLDNLLLYFMSLYSNVKECRFEFDKVLVDQKEIVLVWNLSLMHPKINGGKQISVPGASVLVVLEDQVIHHRDYFDLGAMLYEHLPVIGWVTKKLKGKLGQ